MGHDRRRRLARTLTTTTDLTYSQALDRLAAYVAAHRRLPRTDTELADAAGTPAAAAVALRPAAEVTVEKTYTINYSGLSRCPGLVMSVSHWLPGGVCAHQQPSCPTCGGTGQLATGDGPVVCDVDAPVPGYAPVCDGTGTWAGTRHP